MNNDIKFLNTEWEHNIPSHILKTILDCRAQLFFRPQYVVSGTFVCCFDRKL